MSDSFGALLGIRRGTSSPLPFEPGYTEAALETNITLFSQSPERIRTAEGKDAFQRLLLCLSERARVLKPEAESLMRSLEAELDEVAWLRGIDEVLRTELALVFREQKLSFSEVIIKANKIASEAAAVQAYERVASCPLSFLQQFLPDAHLDLVKEEMPGATLNGVFALLTASEWKQYLIKRINDKTSPVFLVELLVAKARKTSGLM